MVCHIADRLGDDPVSFSSGNRPAVRSLNDTVCDPKTANTTAPKVGSNRRLVTIELHGTQRNDDATWDNRRQYILSYELALAGDEANRREMCDSGGDSRSSVLAERTSRPSLP